MSPDTGLAYVALTEEQWELVVRSLVIVEALAGGKAKLGRSTKAVISRLGVDNPQTDFRPIRNSLHRQLRNQISESRSANIERWILNLEQLVIPALVSFRLLQFEASEAMRSLIKPRLPKFDDSGNILCPKCHRPMGEGGTDQRNSLRYYYCSSCDETETIGMSRQERVEGGDYSFLEDWERDDEVGDF